MTRCGGGWSWFSGWSAEVGEGLAAVAKVREEGEEEEGWKVGLERRCMVGCVDRMDGREVEIETDSEADVARCEMERELEAAAGERLAADRGRWIRVRLREQTTTPRRMLSNEHNQLCYDRYRMNERGWSDVGHECHVWTSETLRLESERVYECTSCEPCEV